MASQDFLLRGEHIELHNLLKLLAIAPSGGAAKQLVSDRLVEVDGEIETRKSRKLRPGNVVRVGNEEIRIVRGDAP